MLRWRRISGYFYVICKCFRTTFQDTSEVHPFGVPGSSAQLLTPPGTSAKLQFCSTDSPQCIWWADSVSKSAVHTSVWSELSE